MMIGVFLLNFWSISIPFFGRFSVDRFASSDTAKCRRFYSKFCCPESEGTDTFSTTWEGENNWHLAPRVFRGDWYFISSRVAFGGFFGRVLFPAHGFRSSVRQVLEFFDPLGIFSQ